MKKRVDINTPATKRDLLDLSVHIVSLVTKEIKKASEETYGTLTKEIKKASEETYGTIVSAVAETLEEHYITKDDLKRLEDEIFTKEDSQRLEDKIDDLSVDVSGICTRVVDLEMKHAVPHAHSA